MQAERGGEKRDGGEERDGGEDSTREKRREERRGEEGEVRR